MAFDNDAEAYGPPTAVPFGGTDTFGANRAYVWNTSRVPVAPSDQNFDGIASNDGKAGIEAVPGRIVRIETISQGIGVNIVAGTTYTIDTSGRISATAGNALKAIDNRSGTDPATAGVIRAIVWKNRT